MTVAATLTPWRRYCVAVCVLGLLVLHSVVAPAHAQNAASTATTTTTLPSTLLSAVQTSLPAIRLRGQIQYRYWGLAIYQARLYTAPSFDLKDVMRQPFVLQLQYQRDFSGAAIAERSIQEMNAQQRLTAAQTSRWSATLKQLFPDVKKGDTLSAWYQVDSGLQLWHNDQLQGKVDDVELAQRFLAIWLSEQASDLKLRSTLLGLP